MNDFGDRICAVLKTHKEELQEIMATVNIETVMGTMMYLGDTDAFKRSASWTPHLERNQKFPCRSRQCNGVLPVSNDDGRRALRDEIEQTAGGAESFGEGLRVIDRPMFRSVRFAGKLPFHPSLWERHLSSSRLDELEKNYAMTDLRIKQSGLPETAKMVIGSFEEVLLQRSFFGNKPMIESLRSQKDVWMNFTDPLKRALMQRGCQTIWRDLAALEDLQRLYDNGNIPLGLNAERTMLVLCRD